MSPFVYISDLYVTGDEVLTGLMSTPLTVIGRLRPKTEASAPVPTVDFPEAKICVELDQLG